MSVVLLIAATLAALATAAPLDDLRIFGYDPKASAAATVTSGNARFTVLTDAVIRMEYSSNGTFEDRATLAVVNRKLPVPQFTQTTTNGKLEIKTSVVTLTYVTGQAFSGDSLWAATVGGASWNFGAYDRGNLFGTIKSLDLLCNPTLNCTLNADWRVHSESLHCAFGVASTGGWTTVDDTKNYIMSSVAGQWFDNGLRDRSDVDVYFFGHGTNFKRAIYDYVQLAGKAPMLTKNLLGSWYTRWFDFDNDDLVRLLDTYRKTDLPLDVLILDMNWHKKDAWTGYSFDRQLYPVPEDTINMVHSHGLVIGANLHDAEGFGYWEDQYATMAQSQGIDPASMMTVPFAPLNATYMHTMEDKVLQQLGFDIWWIDWQQGGNYGGCDGNQMNPTILTNHVRSTDPIRRGDNYRGNILARWGGLGTHRYPVGFSGDVSDLSWTCFEYQPYFVATAANVAYGYISNDLVGPATDHELHVRWMQFGAFSPIMRIHDRGMSSGGCYASDTCGIVDMWQLPYDMLEAIRMAMKERNSLLPYMYTMMRQTYDTGLAMVHPLYYDFPSHSSAYAISPGSGSQYMFGDDMTVAPITKESSEAFHITTKSVWIPPGTWYDNVFGTLVTGPQTVQLQYTLYDVPLFIRAGAVIPRIPNPSEMGVAGTTFAAVDWYIYPGQTSGSGQMYEDDGVSLDYVGGGFAYTVAHYQTSGLTTTVTVRATNGTYRGQPASRVYRIALVQSLPLASATLGSVTVPYKRFPKLGELSWTYDGASATVTVDCGSQSTSQSFTLTVTYAVADATPSYASKAKAYARRSMLAKRVLDEYQFTPDSGLPGHGFLKMLASTAGQISALACSNSTSCVQLLQGYPSLLNESLAQLAFPVPTLLPWINERMFLQLYNGLNDTLLCGSVECMFANILYEVMWIEGFPAPPGPNSTELYVYYSMTDNWATTRPVNVSGYRLSPFTDGHVYVSSGAGRQCLTVYVNNVTGDHLTTSTDQGRQWAADHGYHVLDECIAYVGRTPSSAEQAAFLKSPDLLNIWRTRHLAQRSRVRRRQRHYSTGRLSGDDNPFSVAAAILTSLL